jgi:hypothetical protein
MRYLSRKMPWDISPKALGVVIGENLILGL